MKMLKKIAITAMMIILTAALNVYAGVTEVVLTTSDTEVEVGDTVTITLSAKSGTGIEGIDSTLEYDSTKLKLTNEDSLAAKGFASMSGTNATTGDFKLSVLYTGTDNAPQQAQFATLTFEVLAAASDQTLSIKLSDIQLGDSNDEWTELEDEVVTIKVAKLEVPDDGDDDGDTGGGTGSGTQKPDDGTTGGTQNPDSGDGDDDGNEGSGTGKPGEDDSTADGDINYAGIEDYALILIIAGTILAVVLYKKTNKMSDI